VLTACAGSNSVGVVPDRLPTEVEAGCEHPSDVISNVRGSSVGSDEIRMGRLGDSLLDCGELLDIAVDAYNGVRDTLNPEKEAKLDSGPQ